MDWRERCRSVRLILSDVDGVLTDGRVALDDQGRESKRFHVRDGMGIRLWQECGGRFGLISSRRSEAVRRRAREMGMAVLVEGRDDKLAAAREVLEQAGLAPEEACFLGDDLLDVALIRAVGLGVAVADACEEARHAAHLVTQAPGGAGAVRELVEAILKAQGRWEAAIGPYLG